MTDKQLLQRSAMTLLGLISLDFNGQPLNKWDVEAEELVNSINQALAKPDPEHFCDTHCVHTDHHPDCELAQPEHEPVAINPIAYKLVPVKPTKEMIKAMKECSEEGYDSFLGDGYASSIYSAAVVEAKEIDYCETFCTERFEHNPAGWFILTKTIKGKQKYIDVTGVPEEFCVPLYTAPPKREWVGLTDDERVKCYETTGHYQTLRPQDSFAVLSLARAIEAKLGEKNYG